MAKSVLNHALVECTMAVFRGKTISNFLSIFQHILPGRLLSLQLSKRPGSNQRADAR
jgi:hypothetical protein